MYYIINRLSQLAFHIVNDDSDLWEGWRTKTKKRKDCSLGLCWCTRLFLRLSFRRMQVFLWEDSFKLRVAMCDAGFSPFFLVCRSTSRGSVRIRPHRWSKCFNFKRVRGALGSCGRLRLPLPRRSEIWPVADGAWKDTGGYSRMKGPMPKHRVNDLAPPWWQELSEYRIFLCEASSCSREMVMSSPRLVPCLLCAPGWPPVPGTGLAGVCVPPPMAALPREQ